MYCLISVKKNLLLYPTKKYEQLITIDFKLTDIIGKVSMLQAKYSKNIMTSAW